MNALELSHVLDRRVTIRARREIVFRYFTDPARWAAWWGEGSTIDARPGGKVYVRHPNAVEMTGEVLEVDPPHRIVFSYGYPGGTPFPSDSSRVTIELEEDRHGTRLHLRHAFRDVEAREHHEQGWRYQLAVFSNVVADQVFARISAERVDGWFAAWSEPDAARRAELLDAHVSADVRFRDRFSLVEGRADLDPHLAAVHMFMPGTKLERQGEARQCQGTVLADWIARRADGTELGRGTNVFGLDADGRIAEVAGIWGGR